MSVNLGQIEGTIRSYKEALEKNLLTEKEKKECKKKIEELEKMKREHKSKNLI